MDVFSKYAPLYWAAGIPVMPLKRNSKAPMLNEWVTYGRVAPTKAMQEHWLDAYPWANIGLPFGPASGLCAVDIDTVDDDIVEAIMDCLPASPWVRVGKKGCGLIFKWHGQKNFKIRDDSGMLCEFLGLGNQLVMPPSIHPDTGEAYTSNTNLWEVLDKVQPLPLDIEEKLRDALGVKGFSLAHDGRSSPLTVVPQGERDIHLVRHAGYLARVVLGIDKLTKYTLIEAMEHMETWVRDFTTGVAGDDMDPAKGVAKLLEFLLRDVENGRTLPEGWDVGLSETQLAHSSIAALSEKNAVQRWSFTKASEWINEQVLMHPNDNNWALARVQEIIQKVASDENFTDLDFNAMIPVLRRALGDVEMSKPDLKRAFKDARSGDGETAEDHEAIARQVIDEMSRCGELRWSQGSFWQWQGSCFSQLDDDEIFTHVAERIKGNALSRRYNDYASLVKTVKILCRKELVETLEIGVNFANGFLDVSGVLHEHSPKFGKTFTMPFNYVAERAGEAHKWLEYLETSWGDDPDYTQKVMALQEAFAATMFGIAPSYQRAILLFGKAGTGKSQALDVLRAMMPPAAVSSVSPHIWGERFALSDMVSKTLNICGELPERSTIDGRAFKEIIVGEEQRTERKNQNAFAFTPIAAHWFASNFLPKSEDSSEGFVRRWLILEFNRIVPENERVRDYAKVLIAEEREAIAAWAVQGLVRLMKQRDYTQPASHLFKLKQIKRANNSVAAFLGTSAKIRPREEGDVGHADLMECFDQYCWHTREVARGYPVAFERFMQMVAELGYDISQYADHEGVERYQALGLKVVNATIATKWAREAAAAA